MFSYQAGHLGQIGQLGQIVPGALLSLSLTSGLGITITPAITEFVEKAELASITYAQSALTSSVQINYLLARLEPSNKMIIEGQEVNLKHGYPVAKIHELEKVASFGTQVLESASVDTVTVWSMYKSYCFTYKEAQRSGSFTEPAIISDISIATDTACTP